MKIHDTLTRLEYKEDNGEFLKNKVRLCARGDQQIPGVSFQEFDLYAPVLKAAEARLLLALAAANAERCKGNQDRYQASILVRQYGR